MDSIEERVRILENAIAVEFSAIKTTMRNFSLFIAILGSILLFMLSVLGWGINRIIEHNDQTDDNQSQMIAEMRLDYTRTIDNLSLQVLDLKDSVNNRLKK